mgnify:CR=1 FL=1
MPMATELWIRTLDAIAQDDTKTEMERDLAMIAVGLIQASGLTNPRVADFLQRRAEMAVGS